MGWKRCRWEISPPPMAGRLSRGWCLFHEMSGPSQKAIIKLVSADQEEAAKRMAAWEAATALSHPNLMQVFAYGRCQIDSVPLFYVVTEFADEVLAEVLRERPLTPQETHEMLGPALDALSYLHGKGFDSQPVEAVEHHGRQRPLEAVRGWPLLYWNHREAVSGAKRCTTRRKQRMGWSGPRLTSGRWVPHLWRFSGSGRRFGTVRLPRNRWCRD